ncbi:hypothetical protein J2P12_05260 [Candidatus Bathyarchaeota archaeon]|nr:hypothetical protein [Candidatus Bathyarchaeota archaeon]
MTQLKHHVSSVEWVRTLRIANPPPSLLVRYTRKEKDFFYDYANFIVRTLQDSTVIERISQILSIENVDLDSAIDIRIMVFPARSFRGQQNRMLHGSYNSDASQISLYPVRVPKDWIRREGSGFFRQPYDSLSDRKRRLLLEIVEGAIGTLLHEIFHVKLGPRGMPRYVEESIVKKMEAQYMSDLQETISSTVQRISDLNSVASQQAQTNP